MNKLNTIFLVFIAILVFSISFAITYSVILIISEIILQFNLSTSTEILSFFFFFPLFIDNTFRGFITELIWLSILVIFILFILRILMTLYRIIFSKESILLNIERNENNYQKKKNEKIILVIPAFNEEKTIGNTIQDHKSLVDEIIVVNDGSLDRTAEIAKRDGAIVISNKKRLELARTMYIGLNTALDRGAEIIVTTDADGQYIPSDVKKLISVLGTEEADMVLGSRFAGKIEEMSLMKRIGNRTFTRVLREMSGIPISDGQTGLRAFRAHSVKKILPLMVNSFTYTQQQILIAGHLNLKVLEVPITFIKRKHGTSRLMKSPFNYAYRAWIALIFSYSFVNPRKIYTKISTNIVFFGFMTISLTFPLSLLPNLFLIEEIFLVGMFILLFGLQILLFAFLSRKKGEF